MTTELTERCYLYRFFDGVDRLLYVGIARDLGSRFASHRRGSAWWSEATRGTTVVYPSRVAAELAEAIAILAERPIYNASRPSQTRVETLHELAVSNETDVSQLVAEIERLRELTGAQTIRLAKMQGNLDAAREAYRGMRAKYLEVDATAERWKREYFLATASQRAPVEARVSAAGDWGAL